MFYEWVSIDDINGGVLAQSTSGKVLDWLQAEIRKQIPTAEIRYEEFDLVGVRWKVNFHSLGGKDHQVRQFVFRLLCENGFEPLALGFHREGKHASMDFRRTSSRHETTEALTAAERPFDVEL